MKVGVFLTPGAARTAYQVGALKTLIDEGGIHFDVIAASSVGTLNGAFAATGQIDVLARLWAGWHTRDIFGVDWRELRRGWVWWAANLMQNDRQRDDVIDRYIESGKLRPGVRFRFNLADLTNGRQRFVEWPQPDQSLQWGVNASVAVPAAIRPAEDGDTQLADGLTIDGFPVEELILGEGIDRLFVIGVSPRRPDNSVPATAYGILLRALEVNQFSETDLGLARAEATNETILSWRRSMAEVRETLSGIEDPQLRDVLIAESARIHDAAGFPYTRQPVEIIPILPEWPTRMFFTSYRPPRSRALLAQGRRDGRRVLESLAGR
jgi:predicted acylesterase/phospholipase RssA